MSKMTITRTDVEMPDKNALQAVSRFLFQCFEGATKLDNARWRRFWKMATGKEPGEMLDLETVFPRYTPFHRRHMKIEQTVFNAQERFTKFEQFRNWLKIGAGFVEWVPGAKGGIVPLPRSISYAETEEQEFRQFHADMIEFLRGPHAAPYLWKHLPADKAHDMMDTILQEFGE